MTNSRVYVEANTLDDALLADTVKTMAGKLVLGSFNRATLARSSLSGRGKTKDVKLNVLDVYAVSDITSKFPFLLSSRTTPDALLMSFCEKKF